MKNLIAALILIYLIQENSPPTTPGKGKRRASPPQAEATDQNPVQTLPLKYSIIFLTIPFAVCYLLGIFIGPKGDSDAAIDYFAYWMPCAAAAFFGIGTAYRPATTTGIKIWQIFIHTTTDKELFEISGCLLYAGLFLNILGRPCSTPATEIFLFSTVILTLPTYIHLQCHLKKSGGSKFWRTGMIAIAIASFAVVISLGVLEYFDFDTLKFYAPTCRA